MKTFLQKHFIFVRILPILLFVLVLKYVFIELGWDVLALNNLLSTVVAADVFLLGFLIAGSLPDYKEAERLPGEMATAFDSLVDECIAIYRSKNAPAAKEGLHKVVALLDLVKKWFHKKAHTRDVMKLLRELTFVFTSLEPFTQANFIVRLKQEQSAIRRMVTRVHTIRETSFVVSAYAVAETFTAIVLFALLVVDLGEFWLSMLLVFSIGYLLLYMIALIKDLDNPFHYHEVMHSHDEIALSSLESVIKNAKQELADLEKEGSV